MRDRKEYLTKWKEQKRLTDPEYFKKAAKKAYEKRKKMLEENPEERKRVAELGLQSRKNRRKEDPRNDLLADARKRAKKKGMGYNLTKEDIPIPEYCPVFGVKLEVGDGKRQSNSPSIDRVDNSKGYTKDNVEIICLRANQLKNDATIEEIRAILRYMEEREHGLVWN